MVLALRLLTAALLFVYVYFSLVGTYAAVQADRDRAELLRVPGTVSSVAANKLDPNNEGQLVHVQGMLSGEPALDPETGAQLAAVRVQSWVSRRIKYATSGGGVNPTLRVRYRWESVPPEELSPALRNRVIDNPSSVTIGGFELSVASLPHLKTPRLTEQVYRIDGDRGYTRLIERVVAPDDVVVRYRGIEYGQPFTALGVQSGSTLTGLAPEVTGQRPLRMIVPGHLSVAEMADLFVAEHARQPSDWDWLYLLVLWLAVALALSPALKLPGIAGSTIATFYQASSWPRRIALQWAVASVVLLVVYAADRLL